MQIILSDFDESPAAAYEQAIRANKECYARIVALLERRGELPVWLVEALESILEEVL